MKITKTAVSAAVVAIAAIGLGSAPTASAYSTVGKIRHG
jgi:hypothetical protein